MYSFNMVEPIRILSVEREGEDGLIVTFSDGTTDGYVAEELLELRPFREPIAASCSVRHYSHQVNNPSLSGFPILCVVAQSQCVKNEIVVAWVLRDRVSCFTA